MSLIITDEFYTLTETADVLGVERHSIWRWVREGKVPAQKAGGVVFIERAWVRMEITRRRAGR